MRALYAKVKIKKILSIDVPVFIINSQHAVIDYNEEWQQQDMITALRYDFFELPREFINNTKQGVGFEILKMADDSLATQSFQTGFAIFNKLPLFLQKYTLSFLTLDELLKMTHPLNNKQENEARDCLIHEVI